MIHLYPWLREDLARMIALKRADRLPHALMLIGPEGIGKARLAERFAQAVLCHQPGEDGSACGQCVSCRPFQAGAHPDFTRLSPEEPGKPIKIDAVRDFCAAMQLTSQFGHGKVGIIQPADAMNVAAANALLKTLEEPPAGTLIVLVSAHPSRLPMTIRSRCQRWLLSTPDARLARDWLARQPQVAGEDHALLLELAEGRPLVALELASPEHLARRRRWIETLMHLMRGQGNPVAAASGIERDSLQDLVHWSALLVTDLVRLRSGLQTVLNRDFAENLPAIARWVDARALFSLYDHLNELSGMLRHPLNRDLLLEDILLRFARLGGRS